MLKFFRRVFVLLVLFFVTFVIFRIVKPEATSNFVEKVRSIPQRLFHRDSKKDSVDDKKIIIDWISSKITWDVIDKKDDNDEIVIKKWDSIDDFLWLDELEKNTQDMLGIKQKEDEETGVVIEQVSQELSDLKSHIMENSWYINNQCKDCMSADEIKDYVEQLVLDLITNRSGLNNSNTLKNDNISENTWVSNTTTNTSTTQTNTSTTNKTTVNTNKTITTKKRTNCCDANCVLSASECDEVNMIWKMIE